MKKVPVLLAPLAAVLIAFALFVSVALADVIEVPDVQVTLQSPSVVAPGNFVAVASVSNAGVAFAPDTVLTVYVSEPATVVSTSQGTCEADPKTNRTKFTCLLGLVSPIAPPIEVNISIVASKPGIVTVSAIVATSVPQNTANDAAKVRTQVRQ